MLKALSSACNVLKIPQSESNPKESARNCRSGMHFARPSLKGISNTVRERTLSARCQLGIRGIGCRNV